MANAFYSLYSHVSRTPLQKLAPPEFSFSPVAEKRIGARFFGSVRSEPRSPVERLKDTVSKMCLYAGSRTSESTSPHSSPRKRASVPEIPAQLVYTDANASGQSGLEGDNSVGLGNNNMGHVANVSLNIETVTDKGTQRRISEDMTPQTGLDSNDHSKTLLSGSRKVSQDPANKRRVRLTFSDPCQSITTNDVKIPEDFKRQLKTQSHALLQSPLAPVPKVTHDIICPPIVEEVHQAPYCNPQDFRTSLPRHCMRIQPISVISTPTSPTELKEQTVSLNAQRGENTNMPKDCSERYSGNSELPTPSSHPSTSRLVSPCQILVTGWDGKAMHEDTVEDVPPPAMCAQSFPTQPKTLLSNVRKNRRYLSPLKDAEKTQLSHKHKQANSFELEEVCAVCLSSTVESSSSTTAHPHRGNTPTHFTPLAPVLLHCFDGNDKS